MGYKFYYKYRGEVYGVIEHYKDRNVLEVELIRASEREDIWDEWLTDKIENGEIELFYDKDNR